MAYTAARSFGIRDVHPWYDYRRCDLNARQYALSLKISIMIYAGELTPVTTMGFMQAVVVGLSFVLSWPAILFLVLGTMAGLLFGAIPGLGGVVVLALLIPLTIGLDANTTMVLFGGALGGVAFGGSISAILINVPGTVANTATLLDGHPMTKKGESGKALGTAATASALGALFGILVLIAVIPFVRIIAYAIAAPEYFVMTLFGLTIIAFVTKGDFLKGVVSGGIGMLLAFFGFSPFTTTIRYNYIEIFNFPIGQTYLYDGIKLVPAVIGLFAIGEALLLIAKPQETIADEENYRQSSGAIKGVASVFRRPLLLLQSATIGVLVGIVPGVGGSLANFVSYLVAKKKSKNPEQFGSGYVGGVIASEAANDASDGGSLLPTLAFGIPGSAPAALVLAALILHGISPGPDLLTKELDLVFILIIALLLSNLLTSIIGLSLASYLSKITIVSTSYIAPVIIVIGLTGAYTLNGQIGDLLMATIFGVFGLFMVMYSYSRIALIIGLILGAMAETAFIQTIKAYDAGAFVILTRPISGTLVILLLVIFGYPIIKDKLASS